MFWVLAGIALFAGALITFLPLLRGKTFWQPAALALTFMIPAAALWLYTAVGTPEAIGIKPTPHSVAANASDPREMDSMIDGLRSRLTESPEDFDGWMLLARTLKTTQRLDARRRRDRGRCRNGEGRRGHRARSRHSIRWSARNLSDGGIVSPSAVAVFELIANSNLSG